MLTNLAFVLFVYGQLVPLSRQVLFYNQLSVDKYTFLRFRHPCMSVKLAASFTPTIYYYIQCGDNTSGESMTLESHFFEIATVTVLVAW